MAKTVIIFLLCVLVTANSEEFAEYGEEFPSSSNNAVSETSEHWPKDAPSEFLHKLILKTATSNENKYTATTVSGSTEEATPSTSPTSTSSGQTASSTSPASTVSSSSSRTTPSTSPASTVSVTSDQTTPSTSPASTASVTSDQTTPSTSPASTVSSSSSQTTPSTSPASTVSSSSSQTTPSTSPASTVSENPDQSTTENGGQTTESTSEETSSSSQTGGSTASTTLPPDACIIGDECVLQSGEFIFPSEEGFSYLEGDVDSYIRLKMQDLELAKDETLTLDDGVEVLDLTLRSIEGDYYYVSANNTLNISFVPGKPKQLHGRIFYDIINFTSASIPVTGNSGSIKFPEGNDPYPDIGNWTWSVVAENAVSLQVTIEEFDIDTSQGDFFTINAGPELVNDEGTLLLAHNLKANTKLNFINSNSFYVQFEVPKHKIPSTSKGFRLSYETIEELTTTDPPTSPPTTVPPATVEDTIQVYLEGKSADEFYISSNQFRSSVGKATEKYGSIFLSQVIDWNYSITKENVHFWKVSPCPVNWPDSETCVLVNFSVSLLTVDGSYEMTRQHLEDMWESYHRNITQDLNMALYVYPEDEFMWWTVASLVTLAVFVVGMIVVWCLRIDKRYDKVKKPVDIKPEFEDVNWPSVKHDVPPFLCPVGLDDGPIPDFCQVGPDFNDYEPVWQQSRGIDNIGFDNLPSEVMDEVDDFDSEDEVDIYSHHTEKTIEREPADHIYEKPGQKLDDINSHMTETVL